MIDKNFEYFFYIILTDDKTKEEFTNLVWKKYGFIEILKYYENNKINYETYNSERNIPKEYNKLILKIYEKYPYLKKNYNIDSDIRDALLVRYYLIDSFTSISLSVNNRFKNVIRKYFDVKHEMFGSIFNTSLEYSYCCIFPDLESPRCVSDFYDFDIKDDSIKGFLVNPPYIKNHIIEVGEKILQWLKLKIPLRFVVILPLWDSESRKKYNLKEYSNLPIITSLLNSPFTVYSKISTSFPFYNGVTGKNVILKDPIHIIVLENFSESWSENQKKLFESIV
jgi:hypothetical protein